MCRKSKRLLNVCRNGCLCIVVVRRTLDMRLFAFVRHHLTRCVGLCAYSVSVSIAIRGVRCVIRMTLVVHNWHVLNLRLETLIQDAVVNTQLRTRAQAGVAGYFP